MNIVLTGAGGFIGSRLAITLQEDHNLTIVDDWSVANKVALAAPISAQRWHRDDCLDLIKEHHVDAVIHLGARTDTAEQDLALFDRLNLQYSKDLWAHCTTHSIPFYYASSAATYGLGNKGFSDDPTLITDLQPLNPYGQSKQDFDLWVLAQKQHPPAWAGFKFFNVYGPHEQYKGRMASVVWHTYQQIKATGAMKLFRSHRSDIADGQQSRDFVYVDDVTQVLTYFLDQRSATISGIYNLGTGKARPFIDLAKLTFEAQGLTPDISFIDTPADIRETYQYYTQADLTRLRATGYARGFRTLEQGVADYVTCLIDHNL
jgi:ADP-L-glycero-D-manno-heptose 6-epimerase